MISLGLGIRQILKRKYSELKLFIAKKSVNGLDENMYLFLSMQGRSFSDNPKALSDYIELKDPKAIIVWAFDSYLMANIIKCVKDV